MTAPAVVCFFALIVQAGAFSNARIPFLCRRNRDAGRAAGSQRCEKKEFLHFRAIAELQFGA